MGSSNVADLAREEAARAEVENPDDDVQPEIPGADDDEAADDDEQHEQAPPAPEPEGITQAMAEAILDSLTRYKEVVGREVQKRSKVMWDDLAPCPCCMELGPAPGFIFPLIPEPDASIRRQIVNTALGGEVPEEKWDDPDTEMCARCNGLGMLKTGSKVANQTERACTACNSQGWVQKIHPMPVAPVAVAQPWTPQNGVQANAPHVTTDPWGRHVGHVHYGIAPDSIGA